MEDDFARAMSLALQETRASNPMEATRIIQQALGGKAPTAPGVETSTPALTAGRSRIDPSAEDAEIVEDAPPRRRSFREVVDGLAKRPSGLDLRPLPAGRAPALPDGASFERATHSAPHGTRDYRLYRPSPAAGPVRGVVMMLHGCTQSPEDFARGTAMNRQAEAHGLVVIYPEQPRSANQNLCWNWFRPSDQTAASGEPAILADLARTVAARVGAPEGRVFVAGLSAGGAMAAILGRTHPQVFAAAGVHSGLAPGSASDMISAFAAMRGDGSAPSGGPGLPIIVFHGGADHTVASSNGRAVAGPISAPSSRTAEGPGRRAQVTTGTSPAGHPVELWEVEGGGHAWFGGDAGGSYTDPAGPDASAEMVRFFLAAGRPAP